MTFWSQIFDKDAAFVNKGDLHRRSLRLARQIRRGSREVTELRDDLEARMQDLEEHVGALTLMCRSLLHVLRSSDSWNEAEFTRSLDEMKIDDHEHDDQAS